MDPPSRLRTAEDARRLFAAELEGRADERVVAALLDAGGAVIRVECLSVGTAAAVALPFRSLLACALHYGATSVVLAHNHPRGEERPSIADLRVTRLLARTAAPLSVRLLDHLIFGANGCVSFRVLGLL